MNGPIPSLRPRAAKTGFGFDDVMRRPDYTRFNTWYARHSHFGPGRRPA